MNWNEIKEKYPKALTCLAKMFDKDISDKGLDSLVSVLEMAWQDRDLYDFFDEQGIYIGIIYQYYYNTLDTCDHYYFDWEIMFGVDDKIISSDVEESTRTEAEEKAFEKAFEILESKGE